MGAGNGGHQTWASGTNSDEAATRAQIQTKQPQPWMWLSGEAEARSGETKPCETGRGEGRGLCRPGLRRDPQKAQARHSHAGPGGGEA